MLSVPGRTAPRPAAAAGCHGGLVGPRTTRPGSSSCRTAASFPDGAPRRLGGDQPAEDVAPEAAGAAVQGEQTCRPMEPWQNLTENWARPGDAVAHPSGPSHLST